MYSKESQVNGVSTTVMWPDSVVLKQCRFPRGELPKLVLTPRPHCSHSIHTHPFAGPLNIIAVAIAVPIGVILIAVVITVGVVLIAVVYRRRRKVRTISGKHTPSNYTLENGAPSSQTKRTESFVVNPNAREAGYDTLNGELRVCEWVMGRCDHVCVSVDSSPLEDSKKETVSPVQTLHGTAVLQTFNMFPTTELCVVL